MNITLRKPSLKKPQLKPHPRAKAVGMASLELVSDAIDKVITPFDRMGSSISRRYHRALLDGPLGDEIVACQDCTLDKTDRILRSSLYLFKAQYFCDTHRRVIYRAQ